MPLQTTARTPLVSQVIAQLSAQIQAGEWCVGSRIPPEPELAATLGVGRNTLREAVLALAHAGLLERRQGSGTYVVGAHELTGALHRRVATAARNEALEVRQALEVQAARLAALRRTQEDLTALDGALAAREAAWASGDAAVFVETDVVLHQTVVAAAHNSMLAELYRDFSTALRASIADFVGDQLEPRGHVDHARLISAIRAGDPGAAAAEATAYLEASF